MSKKTKKTLAMHVLDGQGIEYEVLEYRGEIHNAEEFAEGVGIPPHHVYKTLVALSDDPGDKPMLVMIPADHHLNLKKLAQETGIKKIQMARHEEAEKLTGLKTGGISALALLNKGFRIILDEWAILLEWVSVSAGERGYNLKLRVDDLLTVTQAEVAEVSEDKK